MPPGECQGTRGVRPPAEQCNHLFSALARGEVLLRLVGALSSLNRNYGVSHHAANDGRGIGSHYYDTFPNTLDQFLATRGMARLTANMRVDPELEEAL